MSTVEEVFARMIAKAWAEGYRAGHEDHRDDEDRSNPYRAAMDPKP